ncbi:sensor histidine kinase [Microbacterium sp. GXF7504]
MTTADPAGRSVEGVLRRLTRRQLAFDLVGAGVYLFVFAALPGERRVEMLLLLVVFTAALAVRRLSPGLALAIAWVGALVQMLVGVDPAGADVAIFAVLYVTSAYGTRLEYWLGFASSFVGAALIAVYVVVVMPVRNGTATLTVDDLPLAFLVLTTATFGLLLAWTAGALVRMTRRARENRLAQRVAEAEAAVEQERVQIARDMHDVVAHSLAVVIAQADGARYAAKADPAAAETALVTIAGTARAALTDVRLLLTQLRHREGDGPQPTLADLDGLFAQFRDAGLDLRVRIASPPDDASAAVQLAVYRILQEALTNALRHGDRTAPVEVAVTWQDAAVELRVRNRAAGAQGPGGGHGIVGMGERATLVGGTLHASPDGVGGFVVSARIPVGAGA